MGDERPYRDEDWLRQKYVGDGLTDEEIGELCGASHSTIHKWRQKFGIERGETKKYTDKEWLRDRYVEDGLTQSEIADECGVRQTTISDWLKRHGFERKYNLSDDPIPDEEWVREQYVDERRPSTEIADDLGVSNNAVLDRLREMGVEIRDKGWDKKKPHASYRIHNEKNPVWRDRTFDQRAFVHSVLAIAEGYDPHKVFSTDYHVHHKLNPPTVVLNVGWNVEVLTAEEHASLHNTPDEPYADGDWLRQKYVEERMSGPEIADLCDVHFKTIYRWMEHHGIERRDQSAAHATSRSMSS